MEYRGKRSIFKTRVGYEKIVSPQEWAASAGYAYRLSKLDKPERTPSADLSKLDKTERTPSAELSKLDKTEWTPSAELSKLDKTERTPSADFSKMDKRLLTICTIKKT